MNNWISLGIIGLYTIIYVIIFFIQKAQIDKQKAVVNSMKSFMDIFKVDEVKKYVDLKDESMKMKVEHTLNNSEKLKEIAEQAVRGVGNEIAKVHNQQLQGELWETVEFINKHIQSLPKDQRISLVEKEFPKTKRFFSKMVEEMNKENS